MAQIDTHLGSTSTHEAPTLRLIEGGEVSNPAQIARYDFMIDGEPKTAVLATYEDPRVQAAIEMEIDTFEVLGDKRDEVREEFLDYNPDSIFLFIHDTQATEAETDASQMIGMGRFLPYIDGTGLKTFNDLGEIAAKTPLPEARTKILGALGIAESLEIPEDDQAKDEQADFITKRVEVLFAERYVTEDQRPARLLDIATLAPNMETDYAERFKIIRALLTGMALFTTQMYQDGELTHLVQFTAVKFHDLLQLGGFPVQELFGLSGISYDSFGNGSVEDNMTSTPSVLDMDQLMQTYFYGESELPYLRELAGVLVDEYGQSIQPEHVQA